MLNPIGILRLRPWSRRLSGSSALIVGAGGLGSWVAELLVRAGVGRLLLQALIDAGRLHGYHALLARISADNEASILLHAALGFTVVGTLREVGAKFGRTLDVAIMEMLV